MGATKFAVAVLAALPASLGFTAATHAGPGGTSHVARSPARAPAHLAPPAPVVPAVSPALAGEGHWRMAGPRADGISTMYVTQFRADRYYPTQITYAVWVDTRLLHLELVPGSVQPGGTWSHPFFVAPSELGNLAAAFNGGFQFKVNDARGGFYLGGTTAVPLVQGAASLVLYKDGRVNIGSWGTEVSMTPQVQAVLQNVVLMVDRGHVNPSTNYTDIANWGFALHNVPIVPRSGIGVTADGALVYVAGAALTSRSLAESLRLAGAVRAMTLDINPYWVTFNFYSHPVGEPTAVHGNKLYGAMQRSADRYLPPYWEARDFIEILR